MLIWLRNERTSPSSPSMFAANLSNVQAPPRAFAPLKRDEALGYNAVKY